MKKQALLLTLSILFCFSCEKTSAPTLEMNSIAEAYVKLVLEIGQYDSDFVDAYHGPEDWKPKGERLAELPSQDFIERASTLLYQLEMINSEGFGELEQSRLNMMNKQLVSVKTKVEMLAGKSLTFDEEAKLLYDAEPPHYDQSHFDSLLNYLDHALEGNGSISERFVAYSSQFIIPRDKLDAVFKAAITEARKRTDLHFNLPENENFALEYVNDKSWSGYNYYQGESKSLIQLNTDFPIYIERAIDLACHEGYPGHHVFNALLEQNLVNGKGWIEFSVYPLFSPQSLIAEGSANYGIDVAFPGEERINFEKEVLFPLAGIDPNMADQYYEIQELRSKLDYAGNEAARKYLNKEISREEAAIWLEKYLLYEPERALQRTRFFDQYRSYVINYNLGRDLVDEYIKAQGGTADHPEQRWAIFKSLLSNPHTASGLK
ncbi:hypothetical protein [Roseivirga echinicomitans]|uniref:DUF885 domain-containing protein n=1 Tax=Roseivirga echinicomitans TaxID=296218 RepID=A0A150X2A1_9BACT|nr:hypothetical protein [Roseivirga echinicomitans]KYG72847.1 hypothetical protein AWN68_09100 [Roseivirga echinicomitans]